MARSTKKDTFIFRDGWLEKMADMTPEEIASVMTAIAQKRREEDVTMPTDRYVKGVLQDILAAMDVDAESYAETCRRRAESVRKRWGQDIQKDTKDTNVFKSIQKGSDCDSDSEYDSDNDNDNDSDDIIHDIIIEKKEKEEKKPKSKSKTIPPTLEMVEGYITRAGITDVDPVTFWNFYEAKGWMIGKNKMKDWHCAVATFQRTRRNGNLNKQQLAEESRRTLGEELLRRSLRARPPAGQALDLTSGEIR